MTQPFFVVINFIESGLQKFLSSMLIFKGVIESLKKSLKDIHTRLCGIGGGWEVVYDKET